jgi:multiple sugar transport system substrate-binding protein
MGIPTGPRRRAAVLALALGLLGTTGLAACGSDEEDPADSGPLTVWSLENQTDRVQATQAVADKFTQATGIKVNIVGTDENQFTQLITSAAAAGKLPDVVGALSLGAVAQMASNDLLDTDATDAVIDELGRDTFSARALELSRQDDKQLAVPSDAWAQLLVYRRDLFDAAGLGAPDTFEKIEQAARTLNKRGMAGITVATVADDAFTEQTFENFALGNGCELVDDGGEVTLDSPQCLETFAFYGRLVDQYSVPGAQDVDTTRATYFAGKAAMVVWSSFILDEMAGLRNDAKPACPQCVDDPAFLAKNSGIVTGVKGPSGSEPAQFGEITSWTITNGGRSESARKFVAYMMDEGYAEWFGVAPEGKVPVRKGTKDKPEKFAEAWSTAPAGVDTKKPLGEIYPAELLDALRSSPDTFGRWGLPQGEGALVGATLGELPVPEAVNALTSGETDAAGAAKQAAEAVRELKKSLE